MYFCPLGPRDAVLKFTIYVPFVQRSEKNWNSSKQEFKNAKLFTYLTRAISERKTLPRFPELQKFPEYRDLSRLQAKVYGNICS
jgi:hypothetical protein